MLERRPSVPIAIGIALILFASAATAATPHAGMLRHPDVSESHIVFRYANDLWLVPREGGVATPLASPVGNEGHAEFSRDGETIAFMANYDGNYDIYTIPVEGGTPFRVTHHPNSERPVGWAPDGDIIFWAYGLGSHSKAVALFTVSPAGGMPEQLPVPYGWNAAISDDGKWLAYNPFGTDYSTWKRYRGGRAPDIWLLNLRDLSSKKITDWEGADTSPMWQGDQLFYVSDAGPAHRLNVWVYDMKTGRKRQVTKHREYDVRWASNGPGERGRGEIVYQYGPELRLLDCESEKSRTVEVRIPGDHTRVRPQLFDASDEIQSAGISATGKRAVAQARGDIWTVPAENGMARAITRTDGVVERNPAWSPDGKWIAYSSDETGEYELYMAQSDGRGETEKLTNRKGGYIEELFWSPDSEKIAFFDNTGTLNIVDVESRDVERPYKKATGGRGTPLSWSHDSQWLTFAEAPSMMRNSVVYLYNVENDELTQVTAGMFSDTWPTFDREGDFLYYASLRDYTTPTSDDTWGSYVYSMTDRLMCVPLREDVEWPDVPSSDEEEWDAEDDAEDEDDEGNDDADDDDADDDEGEDGDEEGEDDAEEEEEPLEIDIEGFERRAILLPVERGSFGRLAVNHEGKLLYVRNPVAFSGGSPVIQLVDIEDDDEMEKTVLSGGGGFDMSADGEKILAGKERGMFAIVDAAPEQNWDEMLSTAGMMVEIDPRTEWRAILNDGWRIMRDFFYDPGMHGVDWEGVRKQYEPMVDDCASRADLSIVIGEMIAELNVGHAYYMGGGTESPASVSVGMLGCDFELDNGAYRIVDIYDAGPWDADVRGPLSRPGIDIAEGDYILAVNGVPVDTGKDPWAAFQALAGMEVVLTVNEESSITDSVRHVVVEPIGSDKNLRYRSWVEKNRAYVDEKSGGRVGYIYVPDTALNGRNDLMRQFIGQRHKGALIIDERWNGGGWSPERFVELLDRPLGNYWAVRDADEGSPDPSVAHYGPKCMLINESAGSGGDSFPFWFKERGVGPLIGTRTWGGLVGLSGNPPLSDGGYMSVPRFAFYNTDGTWGIEGHGVDPDIEVVDDPALMVDGGDPQLDKAIEVMLDEIEKNPYVPVPKPRYPDRSGMGIRPEDK
jgi:tricorn protease